ncbi:hypothetical protein CDD83_1732 [Cordyceps sp. RAO-2017]|nr:hypothetical protein CDD83_1732 [Cordyceps sp. RAO-2017]
MGSRRPLARPGRSWPLLLSACLATVCALDPSICASFNTASSGQNTSIYQTNGLCHDFCLKKNSAYAITQGNSCWCSDYTPAKGKQVDMSECNKPCPAYPDEKCGGQGVFGYIALGGALPSGTKGDPEPEPTPSPTSKQHKTEETHVSSASKSSIEAPTVSEPPAPATSIIQTIVAGGTVQTVTVIPTQSTVSAGVKDSTDVTPGRSGLGTGGVAGIVAAIAVVLAAAAMALFFYFQRKKRTEEDFRDDPSARGSSSGMLGRPEMSGIPGSPGSTGNRSSMLQIDPRMDPFKQGLYARSGSHESINTLGDEHDYSRRIQPPKVLRATNPDPTED